MIQIQFKLPGDRQELKAWRDWVREARRETAHLEKRAKQKPRPQLVIKDALYKRMRKTIFAGFHKKCVYCEAPVLVTEVGDVEHFRPKKGVKNEHGQPVSVIGKRGTAVPHPGYYWLAYHWENLLLSCSRCNRPNTDWEGNKIGKSTYFPVRAHPAFPKRYATRRGEEKKELPLFIHPAKEDPRVHLDYDSATGLLFWASERGEFCITRLGLNRDELAQERRRTYKYVTLLLQSTVQQLKTQNLAKFSQQLEDILDYQDGRAPYALAGRKALEDHTALMTEIKTELLRTHPALASIIR